MQVEILYCNTCYNVKSEEQWRILFQEAPTMEVKVLGTLEGTQETQK